MKSVLMIGVMLVLAGCGTAAKKAVTVEIPVAVGCLGDKPERPAAKFGVGAYPGDKAAAQAALLEANGWQSYAVALEVQQAGCTLKATPAKTPAQ